MLDLSHPNQCVVSLSVMTVFFPSPSTVYNEVIPYNIHPTQSSNQRGSPSLLSRPHSAQKVLKHRPLTAVSPSILLLPPPPTARPKFPATLLHIIQDAIESLAEPQRDAATIPLQPSPPHGIHQHAVDLFELLDAAARGAGRDIVVENGDEFVVDGQGGFILVGRGAVRFGRGVGVGWAVGVVIVEEGMDACPARAGWCVEGGHGGLREGWRLGLEL